MGAPVTGGVEQRKSPGCRGKHRAESGVGPHFRGNEPADGTADGFLHQLQRPQIMGTGVHGCRPGGGPYAGDGYHQCLIRQIGQIHQFHAAQLKGLFGGAQATVGGAASSAAQNVSAQGDDLHIGCVQFHMAPPNYG